VYQRCPRETIIRGRYPINDTILFNETQRYPPAWVFAIALILVAFAWYVFISQVLIGHPFGARPASNLTVWIIFLIAGVGLPLLFFVMKLVVTVSRRSIYIRFIPFLRKEIPLSDVKACKVRTYRPIMEFGGWGIRWASGNRWAYTMSGSAGVQLELLSGKRILIGSRRPDELLTAVNAART